MAKKIMVIDDNPNIIKMLKSRLEANNYEVISALNGEEGLKNFQKGAPDLIILDIIMPNMDGYTFVRKLKGQRRKIPIIVLTWKDKMKDLFEMEGIKDYIVKPFRGEELLEKINKYLK